jgi:glycosyltransferase involved in cell wall biosynthesis
MLSSLKRFIQRDHSAQTLSECIAKISTIKATSSCVTLYGTPTKGHWLGIANATESLFPNCSVPIPQSFSQPILNKQETEILLSAIGKAKFEKVIISGFADYFFSYIDILHTSTSIEVIFHGTIAEFHEPAKQQLVKKIVQCYRDKKIKRVGFIKQGLADVFSKLYGMDCYHCALPEPTIPKNIPRLNLDRNKIHIGVFGADTFNKNLHNQVIHALLIENAVVHVLDKSHFDYLGVSDRIIEHGTNLTHDNFLSVLGSMDLNLYMSYSESWGLVAYESEAMGVPCLMPQTADYLTAIKNALHIK